ncbi:hypothetical protein B0H13DRAFT_1523145, partial [Mycena leptocephala]
GNVAAVQITTDDIRIFFQDSTGAIREGGVTGLFTSGHSLGTSVLVPANEVLPYTPIVAINAPNLASYKVRIRLYFFSRENVLSEYIYPATMAPDANGFMGGPSCTVCLTAQGIVVSNTSQVLYAMANA